MAVRTARLSGPVLLTASITTFLENEDDSGLTILIKWVTLHNTSGTSRTITLSRSVGSGAVVAVWKTSLAGGASLTFEVFWVLEPGEELAAGAGAADVISLTLDGAILDGVAY